MNYRSLLLFLTAMLSSCGDGQQSKRSTAIESKKQDESTEAMHTSVFSHKGSELVSSILNEVKIKTLGQDGIQIICKLELENKTGEALGVISTFYSAFDSFELVVTDSTNRLLAQEPYYFHQSPYSLEGREFPINKGLNSASLSFPISREIADSFPSKTKIRLVGTLPGSSYGRILSTNTLDATIRAKSVDGAE